MSYAKEVKNELIQLNTTNEEQLAELSAMIDLGTELSISEGVPTLWFKSNNPTVARRFLKLLKQQYKIDSTLLTKQQGSFNKGHQVRLGIQESLKQIMQEHGILGDKDASEFLTVSQEAQLSYLRGAFLVSGSVNDPKKAEYHLEIYSENSDTILKIQRLMNFIDMDAKITKRRKGYIVYLKDVNKIEDFLRYIGASQTVFEFEDIRIKRDFNNSINRILNCEIANEKKTIVAANSQLKDIELIEKYHMRLNDKLLQVIHLRKTYPDASLMELIDEYEVLYGETITKSGLNHRFKKIKDLANELRNEG
ncbi:DNA-binding protein WhiA [Acholeplasma laidlawii]|uniref:DNA-binding protein WhiA n=1 Tax=Acholeplasma laidlawii TaxID=2148 RepID=UPI0018C26070|nr:DNA-binding protein WhiA [Acholeplasma laidlawii]MBG0762716.1 DNA-binding protein WhiA [Acholeplasma laidlawii]